MVKNIIKRIIVGVGIALCLMVLKGQLLLDVNAQSINVVPDKICAFNQVSGSSCNWSNINTYTVAERPVYGNLFGANVERSRIIWHFTGSDIKEKTYDISFIIFLDSQSVYDISNRGYIGNGDDNIFSCSIDSTRNLLGTNVCSANYCSSSNTGTAVAHCNNVYFNENYFNFYLLDEITLSNGIVAVSHFSLTENVSAKQTKELEEINESIKDDSIDTGKAETDIDNMKNRVASNGSITQLLTLPITLYQSILNSASSSCSGAFDLGSLLGHHLELPCIQPQRYLGNSIWTIIDMLCSGLFILSFRKKMVDIFNHMTSLNDRGNELE